MSDSKDDESYIESDDEKDEDYIPSKSREPCVCTITAALILDLVFVPVQWNHSCFDIAFLKGTEVYCIQCTIQQGHSRKTNFIDMFISSLLLKGLATTSINLVACVPTKSFEKFEFHIPEGMRTKNFEIRCWKTKRDFGGL